MGLFTKKQKIFDCPICDRQFDPLKDKGTHRQEHVRQIPEGEGEASGQFTWECACGPSGMKWTNDFSASTALGIHWHRSRHPARAAARQLQLPVGDGTKARYALRTFTVACVRR
ncbi:MAG: hypothetical protein U5R31_13235 [Acidimicrobiia bacterium]|nr:hypothetical protein [Acidimicrobiia bacterium]